MNFPSAVAPSRDDASAVGLAQAQFGLDAEIVRFGSPGQVALAVGRGDVQAGLVPLARGDDGAGWWSGSDIPGGVSIVARVPWTEPAASDGAYVLAKAAPEESGDDRSVFVFRSDTAVSRGRLAEMAVQNGLDVGDQAAAVTADGSGAHLLDVAGFVTADDPRVRGISTLLADAPVRWLGAYAAPFGGLPPSVTE